MKKILIVYSDYYKDISKSILNGALKVLNKDNKKYKIFRVDGSFEIPQLINIKMKTKKYNSAIALGCVIKGQTPHFDFISQATTTIIRSIIQG